MAIQDDRYGIIYYNETTTFQAYERKLRIEIRKRDYAGPYTRESIGANLNVDGDVVKKTVANLRLKARKDNQFENLLNDGTMFKVYIQLDDEMIFTGFIDADSFERDYTTKTNYDVLFIARDRLGSLEDSKLKRSDLPASDTYPLSLLFVRLLQPSELDLPVRFNIGIRPEKLQHASDIFNKVFLNPEFLRVDEDKTILDFLEALLEALSCTIQQKNGYWHIEESTLKTERSLIQKSDIHLLHSSATQITKKGLKKINLKQDLQATKNIFKNFPINDEDFTAISLEPTTGQYLSHINGWVMNGNYVLRAFGLGSEIFKTWNSGTDFDISFTAKAQATNMNVAFMFEAGVYADNSIDDTLKEVFFDVYCGDQMLTTDGWVAKTAVTKNIKFSMTGSKNWGEEPDFKKLSLLADSIPYSTGIEVHYYTDRFFHKTMEIQEIYDDVYTLPANKELDFIVNEKNTQKIKEELKFGQVPAYNNSFHNFLGGFFDANKNALVDWKHKNDIQVYDLLQVITDTKVWESGRKRSINAVLAWNYDLFTNIEIEGIKYFIKDVNNWNLSSNELDVQLEEIVEYIEGSKPILKPAVVGDARNIKMIGSSKTNYLTYTDKDITVPVRISALESADLAYSADAYVMVDLPDSSDSKKMLVKDLGDKDGSATQDFETKNLKVHGDLTVYGEVISSPSVEIPIDDAWIKLNNGNSEVDAGIRIDLGGGQTSQIYRKASNNDWYVDNDKIYHTGNLNKSDVDFNSDVLSANVLSVRNEVNKSILTRIANQKIFAIEYGVSAHDLFINSDNIIAKPNGDFEAKIINAENVLINNNQVYHTDNLNKSNVDFAAKDIVSESIKSPNFQNGLLGVGHKFDNGIGELDTLTVRKTMNVYEMLINKVRSIGGEFLISSANGKIKEVVSQTTTQANIKFEIDTEFALNDFVLCQTYTSTPKYYVGIVSNIINSKQIIVDKFYGDFLSVEAGDEIIQRGNANNTDRQSILSLSARTARFSIYQDVSNTDLTDKLKGVFGDLNGLTDAELGVMSGVGLYCDNVYLKGKMQLSAGSSISFADVTGTGDLATNTYVDDAVSDKITEAQATTITNNTIATTNILANNLKVEFANVENFSFNNATGVNVDLSGKITSIEGDIGGLQLQLSRITRLDNGFRTTLGQGVFNNGIYGLEIGKDVDNRISVYQNGLQIVSQGAGKVHVKADGSGYLASGNFSWDTVGNITANNITATNVNLTGVINAESGTIGGLTITNNALSSNNSLQRKVELNWTDGKMTFTDDKAESWVDGSALEWMGKLNNEYMHKTATVGATPHVVYISGLPTYDGYDFTIRAENQLNLVGLDDVNIKATGDVLLSTTNSSDAIITDSMLLVNAGQAIKPTVTNTANNYTITNSDRVVIAKGGGNINLPSSPFLGQTHTVKAMFGGAISVFGNNRKVDNLGFSTITNGNAETYIFDGTNWAIIYRF